MKIYWKKRKKRKESGYEEKQFIKKLREDFPEAEHINEQYRLDHTLIEKLLLEPDEIISAINKCDRLPQEKRTKYISDIEQKVKGKKLKVAKNENFVSFDAVITDGDHKYFWEYHEEQHRKLNNKRRSPIYIFGDNEPGGYVHRGLNRFIKDYWRAKFIRPFTIVWKDWFLKNKSNIEFDLKPGFNEYFIEGKFSFSSLL